MEERESEKHPADRGLVGTSVRVSRIITRCGYWLSPVDLDGTALNNAAVDYLAKQLDLSREAVESVIFATSSRGIQDTKDWRRWGERGDAPRRLYEHYTPQLKNVYRIVRQEWLDGERGKKHEHPINLRTFWYADADEYSLTIDSIATRQIGYYHAGGWTGGYDWEEFDGPYLDVRNTQTLYVARWNWPGKRKVYIHPLDVKGT